MSFYSLPPVVKEFNAIYGDIFSYETKQFKTPSSSYIFI